MAVQIFINDEEVVCDDTITLQEEMLSTSSTILNNCYPLSWETDKDYKDVPHYYQWFENNVDALQIVNGLTTEECEEVSDQDFSDDLANGETPTPTLVLYENGEIVDVYFGIDGTEKIVIAEFISDFYYHEGTFEKNVTRK